MSNATQKNIRMYCVRKNGKMCIFNENGQIRKINPKNLFTNFIDSNNLFLKKKNRCASYNTNQTETEKKVTFKQINFPLIFVKITSS